jgi:hypothetical protein
MPNTADVSVAERSVRSKRSRIEHAVTSRAAGGSRDGGRRTAHLGGERGMA